LGVISFYIDNLHYNLGVKLLNDRYGIQVRGGCSCAGTYGHYLLHVDPKRSKSITDEISKGVLTNKPGWIRMSIHPITTDEEMGYILDAIEQLSTHHQEWGEDYDYQIQTNEICL
jgi:selenocysteine lyase/cysteine desulfurase